MKEIIAQSDYQGTRLDIFLLLNNKDLSRNFISQAIKNSFVKVNGEVVTKSSYKVKVGDKVIFDSTDARQGIQDIDFENVVPVEMKLNIIYEDEELLAIDKPSGMATHPSHGHVEDSLLNAVHFYLHKSDKEVLPLRKHMVHRLDKDTSGIILFAKTDKMLWWLHKQFAERTIEKHYYALSYAAKKFKNEDQISVEGYIERSRRYPKMYLFSNKYGKWTSTLFKIEKSYTANVNGINQFVSLIECKPKTGRTHQIRVHLKSANLPIWSDPIYASDKQIKFSENFAFKNKITTRLFLHAYKLKFKSYTGKDYDFEIPLSSDLKQLLNSFNEV